MTSILKPNSSLACKAFVIYELWLRVQHLCVLPTQRVSIFLLVLAIIESNIQHWLFFCIKQTANQSHYRPE